MPPVKKTRHKEKQTEKKKLPQAKKAEKQKIQDLIEACFYQINQIE